jgi:hypothetical protein
MCAHRNKQVSEPFGIGAGSLTGRCRDRHGETGKGKGSKSKDKFTHRLMFSFRSLWWGGGLAPASALLMNR